MDSEHYGISRRSFFQQSGLVATSLATLRAHTGLRAQEQDAASIAVLFPRDRIPASFIIDDSTCLVNMGHYCMPQFAAAWPERAAYDKPWKTWPREIPDQFVRQFGEWCAEQGVRGKYSVVPYPACVGWLDRELPGWSRRELQNSLKLVRDLLLPNWDIHPEMITHTRVIDLRTGRPHGRISSATMENSYPQVRKSVDELSEYLAYALRILERCDLPCDGVTTPGGFGNLVKSELSLAVQQSVRDVYRSEIPHYFKYVHSLEQGTEPIVEHVSGRGTSDLNLTVNIPAGTGDWFGGWDGDRTPEPDRYCTRDARSGRLVELVERGQPAVFLCHWPGLYSNGQLTGFHAFQQVVTAFNDRFRDRTVWMKPSEMARYWATRELAVLTRSKRAVDVMSPFYCPDFTFRVPERNVGSLRYVDNQQKPIPLREVPDLKRLVNNTFVRTDQGFTCCVHLLRGQSSLRW